jgi:Caspase domain
MKTWLLLLVGLSTNCFGFTASAEERLALLIGNQSYGPKVGALNNPHKDIELVGSSLQRLGFNVVSKKDLERWSRLSEQNFRVDKWSLCRG